MVSHMAYLAFRNASFLEEDRALFPFDGLVLAGRSSGRRVGIAFHSAKCRKSVCHRKAEPERRGTLDFSRLSTEVMLWRGFCIGRKMLVGKFAAEKVLSIFVVSVSVNEILAFEVRCECVKNRQNFPLSNFFWNW